MLFYFCFYVLIVFIVRACVCACVRCVGETEAPVVNSGLSTTPSVRRSTALSGRHIAEVEQPCCSP